MPRVSRDVKREFSEARAAAYLETDTEPLLDFARRYEEQMPQWMRTQINRDTGNIDRENRARDMATQEAIEGATLINSLVTYIDDEGNVAYRTIQIDVEPGMTIADVYAQIDAVLEAWAERYQALGEVSQVDPLYRIEE